MHRLEHELRKELVNLLAFLDESATDGIWYWDIETNEEWYSPKLVRVLGYEPHEVPMHASWWQEHIFAEDKAVALENAKAHIDAPAGRAYDQVVRYRHKDGHTVWIRCRGQALFEQGVAKRMIGAHSDVTPLMRMTRQLEKEARHDPLTTLLNRRGIEDALLRTIQHVQRIHCEAYAVVIDIDDFKTVNDAIGHSGGDRVLVEASRCLRQSVRVTDEIGRLGGDEFIIFVLARDRREAEQVASRVHNNLRECAIEFDGKGVDITLSSALLPIYVEDGPRIDRLDTLLKAAGPYLRKSKQNGKNQVTVKSVIPPKP